MVVGIAGALIMFGVLVVVHELGHFVVARLFKVDTPVFSIGMGPRIFGFRFWDTDFRVSLLPIGGYVRMAGADPFDDAPDDSADAGHFMKKPIWQRLLILLAGPAANLILPVGLFTAVLMLGEPQADPTIGTVFDGTVAEEAGFKAGDRVTSVQGQRVKAWADVVAFLKEVPEDQPFEIGLTRNGEPLDVLLPPGALPRTPTGLLDLEQMGFAHGLRGTQLGVRDAASPAWRAGLRPTDVIEKIDGEEVTTWDEIDAALATGARHVGVALRMDGQRELTRVPFEMAIEGGPPFNRRALGFGARIACRGPRVGGLRCVRCGHPSGRPNRRDRWKDRHLLGRRVDLRGGFDCGSHRACGASTVVARHHARRSADFTRRDPYGPTRSATRKSAFPTDHGDSTACEPLRRWTHHSAVLPAYARRSARRQRVANGSFSQLRRLGGTGHGTTGSQRVHRRTGGDHARRRAHRRRTGCTPSLG